MTSRETQLQECKQRWCVDLARKMQQGQMAQASRRQLEKKVPHLGRFAQRWLVIQATVTFLQRSEERVRERRRVLEGPFLALSALPEDQARVVRMRVNLFSCIYVTKLSIRERRRKAQVLLKCLLDWQKGRCITTMLQFAQRVRKLQGWWRRCMQRVHEARDKVSRRWERLERAELTRELSRVDNPKFGQRLSTAKLTLEEKIQVEVIEEPVRLRFIEHELRARRYLLLPCMQVWEQDLNRWRHEWEEWSDLRSVCKNLDHCRHLEQPLRWPPTRPSYMPPSHQSEEARGVPCPEWCHGRKGDREILDMWRRCRENPRQNFWHDLSTRIRKRDGGPPKAQKADLFGDTKDEDLAKWGVNMASMPGLSKEGQRPTTAGEAVEALLLC